MECTTQPERSASTNAGQIAVYSVRSRGAWQRLSQVSLDELVGYVQPVSFRTPVVQVPVGQFVGGYHCSTHGTEIYVSDRQHRCLAVYEDGTLLRRTGSGRLGCSVVAGTEVYVIDEDQNTVMVCATAGGLTRRLATPGLSCPSGIAMEGARLFVADHGNRNVFELTEGGDVVARRVVSSARGGAISGIAVAGGQMFIAVTEGTRAWMSANRTDAQCEQRRIGDGCLIFPMDVCATDELLFVSEPYAERVSVFDARDGYLITRVDGMGRVHGVAVLDAGALVVTSGDLETGWQVYVVPMV